MVDVVSSSFVWKEKMGDNILFKMVFSFIALVSWKINGAGFLFHAFNLSSIVENFELLNSFWATTQARIFAELSI